MSMVATTTMITPRSTLPPSQVNLAYSLFLFGTDFCSVSVWSRQYCKGLDEIEPRELNVISCSGKEELCKLLVLNGAKTDATNSVKRTPSAMAAFVGNHNCVAVINNFVPKVR